MLFKLWENPKNLLDILQKITKKHPQRLAYIFLEDGENEKANLTYAELNHKAKIIAGHLQKKNMFGQRVLLLYPSGLDFITAFIGCLYAGVVAVPISCPVFSEFGNAKEIINSIANDAKITTILTVSEMVLPIKENLTVLLDKGISIINTVLFDGPQAYQKIKIDTEAIAYLQYTSGSTSTPKGVIVRHKHLSHTLKHTGKVWHYSSNSIAFHWAPHSHAYGLLYGLLTPLYFSALTIFMPPSAFSRQPLTWLKTIHKYQVTHSGAPNFAYELCAEIAKENDVLELDLKSWKVAVVTAEPVQSATLMKFSDKFGSSGFAMKSFFPSYGMSEAGIIASKSYHKEITTLKLELEGLKDKKINYAEAGNHSNYRSLVGCGPLIPGFKVIVVDPNTLKIVKGNRIGEIWLSGTPITDGYWQRPDENSETFKAVLKNTKQIYFRTGDLGFTYKGEIVLTGRLKELIIIYGKNYYPLDLEITAKNAHPLIKDCMNVVFSLELEQKEEVFIIQEIKQEGDLAYSDDVFKAVRQMLSQQQKIDVYGIILVKFGSIPRTSSGKVQRKLCCQWYLEEKLQILSKHFKNANKLNNLFNKISETKENPHSNATKERVCEAIFAKFKKKLIGLVAHAFQVEEAEISFYDPLSKYGFDSLSLVKLASSINDAYGIELTPIIFLEQKSLASLASELFDKYKDVFVNYYSSAQMHIG